MKKFVLFLLLALGSLNEACSCRTVSPGHVGLVVSMVGSEKGVDQKELPVGWHFLGPTESFYDFPTFEQNVVWTHDPHEGAAHDESITFQTKEGMQVNADIGVTYHIEPDKVASVFQKYRRGLEEITDTYLRNAVRDAFNDVAGKMPMEGVYGEEKTKLLEDVQKEVVATVGPCGITVVKVYAVGGFRLPEMVTKALNAKLEATQLAQQRENEIRSAEAEAKKKVAAAQGEAESQLTIAKARAEANRILSESLTPALVEYTRIEKWDGHLPTVSGSSTPFVNIGAK